MKRQLLLSLAATLLALPTLARDFEYTYEGQTITYTVIDETAKTVMTKPGDRLNMGPGNNVSGDLILPSEVYDGETQYTLTEIGELAFSACDRLTSVTIPNSVTTILDHAFCDCSGMKSVGIGNSVTKIGYGAFFGCSRLKTVSIGNSVTEIGKYAFYWCSRLISVVIPNSVTTIGESAFEYCSGLKSVDIGESVSTLGAGAFGGCVSLNAINVAVGNSNYTSVEGVVYSKDMSQLVQYPAGKEDTKFTIPNSVSTIGDQAFYDCNGLTSVSIPNSVTKIGNFAFVGCSGLTSVSIPNSITTIGDAAFRDCSGLTEVTIPNSVTSIDGSTFYGCSGLTSVSIPNSITTIGSYALGNCCSLTSVSIGNSVETIYEGAFSGCSSLTSVTYLAEEPVPGNANIFDEETYQNAALNYLNSAEEKIAATEPWSLFVNRIGRDADYKEEGAISEVEATNGAATAVYDMRGIKVGTSTDGLPKGIYIIREGATTRKVAL